MLILEIAAGLWILCVSVRAATYEALMDAEDARDDAAWLADQDDSY